MAQQPAPDGVPDERREDGEVEERQPTARTQGEQLAAAVPGESGEERQASDADREIGPVERRAVLAHRGHAVGRARAAGKSRADDRLAEDRVDRPRERREGGDGEEHSESRQASEAAARQCDGEQARERDEEGRALAQREPLAEGERREQQEEERGQGAGQCGDRRRDSVLLAEVERQVVGRNREQPGDGQPDRVAAEELQALAPAKDETVEEAERSERRETGRREPVPGELRRRTLAAKQVGGGDEAVAPDQEKRDGDREIASGARLSGRLRWGTQ